MSAGRGVFGGLTGPGASPFTPEEQHDVQLRAALARHDEEHEAALARQNEAHEAALAAVEEMRSEHAALSEEADDKLLAVHKAVGLR